MLFQAIPGFLRSYVVVFSMVRWELIVRSVDIGVIIKYHCLIFIFIIHIHTRCLYNGIESIDLLKLTKYLKI